MPKLKSKAKTKQKNQKQSSSARSEQPELSLKEQLALQRKVQKERQALIQFGSAVLALSGAAGAALYYAVSPIAGLAAGGGIFALVMSYRYPYAALWAFLIYLPLSGTVTYGIAKGNALFQLAKDGIYIPAAIAIYQECKQRKLPFVLPEKIKSTLNITLLFSFMTLFFANGLQQLMGGGTPFLQGLLGLKVFLGYVPLVFCGYYLIRTKEDLLRLSRLHTILAILCCVLGIIQYWLLDTGKCQGTRGFVGEDLFKATLDARCFIGGSVVFSPEVGMIRLPGTFVSPWHWAWFLIANAFLTFTTAFSETSLIWRLIGMGGMGLVFINAVISGQRIALVLVPVVTVILLVLTGQVANLKRFIPIAIALGLALFVAAASNPALVQERVDSFVSRWNAAPPYAFIQHQVEWAINQQRGIFGRGLGKATNSTRIFGKTVLVETYYPKILYEMGFLGTLAYIGFLSSLTKLTFKTYRSVKEKNIRSFGASFWVFVLVITLNTYWYPLDTDPVCVYYWLLAGVIFRLPEIDKVEQERRLAAEAAELEQQTGKRKKSGKARSPTNQKARGRPAIA